METTVSGPIQKAGPEITFILPPEYTAGPEHVGPQHVERAGESFGLAAELVVVRRGRDLLAETNAEHLAYIEELEAELAELRPLIAKYAALLEQASSG
ncbi:MAG: hypothetical protein L0332_34480 [Chloroflexi bacterium]|nr:hypothetical protein [Chloroflexota bacterium]